MVKILAEAYEKRGYTLDKEDAKIKVKEFKIQKNVTQPIEEIIVETLNDKKQTISVEEVKSILKDLEIDLDTAIKNSNTYEVKSLKRFLKTDTGKGSTLADLSNIFYVYKHTLQMDPPQWYAERYATYAC